jgi:O-antigen/teichoic acid export membrane protein
MPSVVAPQLDGRSLVRNAGWNLFGSVAPLLAAVIAIPELIAAMGAARFGMLTLAWVIVGYFSFFDFGLGRALTHLVAERIGTERHGQISGLFWTAISFMFVFGVVGGLAVAAMSPWFAGSLIKVPPELRQETEATLYLLALSIPAVLTSAGFRGLLEAHQRFRLATVLRIPTGVLSFLGPLAILPVSNSLPATVLVLVIVRLASSIVHAVVCLHQYPSLRRWSVPDKGMATELLRFGGWMTISNVIGPLLLYLGRFLIAVKLSAEAVAYFSTPYEIVTQLLLIPAVAVGVLFPAFSQLARRDAVTARNLYYRALKVLAAVMLPVVVCVWLLAQDGLAFWISEEFAANGYRVAQVLVAGVFLNSFGLVSQSLVQAFGRPDWTAKLHALELVAYVPYLVWLIDNLGIEGAAIAWLVRVGISSAALLYLASVCLKRSERSCEVGYGHDGCQSDPRCRYAPGPVGCVEARRSRAVRLFGWGRVRGLPQASTWKSAGPEF